MLANFSGVLYFFGMIYTFLSRGAASLWIMQTTQKFTLQIPFPRLEHFNRAVGSTLYLFAACKASESKTVLDSGFHVVDSRFQVLDSSLCQWNLDSGFQSLVGFRIPWAVFRIPKPGIPDSISKIFPVSGFSYVGWTCLSKTGWRRILRSTRLLCGEILIPIWILNIYEPKLIPNLKRIKLYNRSYFFIH